MQADPPLGLQRQLEVPLQSETVPDTLRPSQINPPGQDIEMGTSEALPQPAIDMEFKSCICFTNFCVFHPLDAI